MDTMTYSWQPSDDYLQTSNVSRLMRRLGATSADELRAISVADIAMFWDTVVADLQIPFARPYARVLDRSKGIERADWFVGGELNVAEAVLERWVAETPDQLAVVHETENGAVRALTYAQLAGPVASLRAGLRRRGLGKGDAVAVFLPMIPEAVVATYAIASIGATVVPLFSGFAPAAVAARIQDAEVKAVITADGTIRRGRAILMAPTLQRALQSCPSVEFVLTVNNLGEGDNGWNETMALEPDPMVERTQASDVLLLAYTSGTTGLPKGAVHTHGGFLVRTASEIAYGFDLTARRRLCWITDMGWIMGPLTIVGTHALGGTLVLYEGSPDVPSPSRLWRLVERHGISTLGVSPTLIRTLRAAGRPTPGDLSSIRTIGSTGEPWDAESYDWLARGVFKGRVPVINFSGGTEVGGSFLCPYPVEEIRSCSLGGPALGMDVDVVDDAGHPLRGAIGELVCRQPWPSMTRSIWRDDERYLEAYWSTFPGMWRHGDFARADEGNGWYVLGRSDDVMNVAGKRVAPSEIEAVLASDPDVAESAVVGIPDQTKGEAVWAFWVSVSGEEGDDAMAHRLRNLVADEVGKPFAPSRVVWVRQLPKTRSAKVMRRAIRAAVLGIDPGDLSGAENPEAVAEIEMLLQEERSTTPR
jgi:acetyl-CoA synthetase